MGHEVAVLRSGRLVQTATPAVLYRTPADLDVARFVGDAVVVPGEGSSGAVVLLPGYPPCTGRFARRAGAGHDPAGADTREPAERDRTWTAGGIGEGGGHSFYGPETVVRLQLADGPGTPVDGQGARRSESPASATRSASSSRGRSPSIRRRGDGVRGRALPFAALVLAAVVLSAAGCGGGGGASLDRALQRPAPAAHDRARSRPSRSRPGSRSGSGRTTASCSPTRSCRKGTPRRPTSTSPRTRRSS